MNSSAIQQAPLSVTVGTRVYSGLYGGRAGTIFAIHGEQTPATIRNFPGMGMVTGGSADFDVVFDNGTISRRIPEAIVRGVQWEFLDGIDTPEMIEARLDHAAKVTAEKEEEAKSRAEAKRIERAELPAKFPFLKVLDGTTSSHAAGAANIRRHLKKVFPGVKFSVRSSSFSGGDSIDVSWTLGPTRDEVEAIIDLYQDSDFDGMQDISNLRDTVFPEIFGGAKYVNGSRDCSEAIEVVAKSLCAIYNVPYSGTWTNIPQLNCAARDYAHRIFCKASLPIGAVVTGAEWPEGQTAGEYRVTFTA